MARRRRSGGRDPDLGDLIMLAPLLLAGWWVTNVGDLRSLLIFLAVAGVGYFTIRIPLTLRAQRILAASGIEDVHRMSGTEFERFALAPFSRKGYRVRETPQQADYGGDLIPQKDGRTVVVQAKRWDGAVGARAVGEVLGAINYYGADKGIVLTNSDFTENAYRLEKRVQWNCGTGGPSRGI